MAMCMHTTAPNTLRASCPIMKRCEHLTCVLVDKGPLQAFCVSVLSNNDLVEALRVGVVV